MRIDTHLHLVPEAYRAELESRELMPYPLPDWTPEMTEAFMRSYAIDAGVVSLSPPGVWFGDAGLARELARMANERTASLVAADRDRYAGLGVLPLPDVDAAVAEIDHVFDVLGLDGVALLTNVADVYVGEPAWDPVLEALDRRGAYVFLHPTGRPWAPLSQIPVWVAEFPFDTTRALVNLIFSGAIERYPALRLQVAHLGGTAPFLAHRIASVGVRERAFSDFPPERVLSALAALYFDTGLSNHVEPIEATLAHVPFEHLVFGSDWPYLALPSGSDLAPDLDALGAERRDALESHHAGALISRWSHTDRER
jgi:6-methylsalicylate decarboxylase